MYSKRFEILQSDPFAREHAAIPPRSCLEKCSCQRELYRPYRGTFPVAPVSQALIIIFTARTHSGCSPVLVPRGSPHGVSRVWVRNSIQSHPLTPARLLVVTDYVLPRVVLFLLRYARVVHSAFHVCFLMEPMGITRINHTSCCNWFFV